MESKVGTLKGFLIVTTILEGSTGLVLMTIPSFVINLLLGSPLPDLISVIITKVGGAAVVSLAIAAWFSQKSESVHGLLIALMFYNTASIILFLYAGLYENLNGMALWPVVGIHVVMGIWNARCLGITTKLNS